MDATLWAILAALFAKVQECDALRARVAELEQALDKAQRQAGSQARNDG